MEIKNHKQALAAANALIEKCQICKVLRLVQNYHCEIEDNGGRLNITIVLNSHSEDKSFPEMKWQVSSESEDINGVQAGYATISDMLAALVETRRAALKKAEDALNLEQIRINEAFEEIDKFDDITWKES